MPERLSLHEKRLLMRYKSLLARYHSVPVSVKVSELAEIMYCTSRYARALLKDMQKKGWLSWVPGTGRGAAGMLCCYVDIPALQALLDGDYMIQTDNSSDPILPIMENDAEGDSYIVQFFRPLMKITPSLYTVWPERHLIQMVHAGLMRFVPGRKEPEPGLALATDISEDKLTWTFHLRRGLTWHTGELFKPAQLLPALQQRAGGPGLPHVSAVELCGHTLRLKLSAPDVLLPHRLAHPANAFAHPEEDTNGLGAFRVDIQSQSALVLKRSPFWYAEQPQAVKISFEVQPCEESDWASRTFKVERYALQSIPARQITGEAGFTFLMFNETRASLTLVQRAALRRIMQRAASSLINTIASISALPDWLRDADSDVEQVSLPPEINVVYCRMPETTALVELLKKTLLWHGCKLNITPRRASHWLLPGEDWSDYDFCVSFQPSGSSQAAIFEEHYRNAPVFRAFMGDVWDERNKILLTRAVRTNRKQHESRIMRGFRTILKRGIITPLYTQHYCLNVPEQARGVEVCKLGWPDFSSIWIP